MLNKYLLCVDEKLCNSVNRGNVNGTTHSKINKAKENQFQDSKKHFPSVNSIPEGVQEKVLSSWWHRSKVSRQLNVSEKGWSLSPSQRALPGKGYLSQEYIELGSSNKVAHLLTEKLKIF